MKKLLTLTLLLLFSLTLLSQEKAKWIWYPGDFDIWLHTKTGGYRQERGQHYPPFWRVDSPYGLVRFETKYDISTPESVKLFVDGKFHVRIDGAIAHDYEPDNLILPAGKHNLEILVSNFNTFPSIMVQGKTINSNSNWLVTNQSSPFIKCASGNFSNPALPPSTFKLSYTQISGKEIKREANSLLMDFGKETLAKLVFDKLQGKGRLKIFYGETKEEALAETLAETYDYFDIENESDQTFTLDTRAFRFINVKWEAGMAFDGISALYEYLPVEHKGFFECSDTLLNRIYDVSLYTLHLNTREFHLDGIKRDRWIWSGDAYQSYLMNFYTFFDEDVNKRTFYALRGHDPVQTHINTILDYSFYWIIGLYDHYMYTGDIEFIKQIYPRMKSLNEFCLSRTNANGFVEGLPGDWVFIDWAPIDKGGEVSFEQLLLIKSLETMALCGKLSGDTEYSEYCAKLAAEKKQKVFDVFWSDKHNAFTHLRKNGVLSDNVTRYANMFAILFDYVDEGKKQSIKNNVILNDNILKITTPYMKFYELASLCEIGEKEKAIDFVRSYWGGMLQLGATSIWEAFDPEQKGVEHYAMYGRPFGKSLCHAWGANPVYLFGKYLLGVKPLSPGYESYIIEPSLAGLNYIKGRVPTPKGNIEVYMDKKMIKIKTVNGNATLKIKSKKTPKTDKGISVDDIGNGFYKVNLSGQSKEYTVQYWQ